MDSEHRPESMMSQEKVAVVQVATEDKIYILDVNALTVVLEDKDWHRLRVDYFLNPKILILGFGIRGDLQIMSKTVPALGDLENGQVTIQ